MVNFVESNPDPGEERDGRDGAARGELPAADGAAARGVAREDSSGARRAEDSTPLVRRPMMTLAAEVDGARAPRARPPIVEAAREAFARLRAQLSAGEVRAAEPDPSAPTGWRVNTWVKQGILLGFRFGDIADMSADHGRWPFFDKDTLPLKRLDASERRSHRAGRIDRARRRLPRARRHLHAADVHQHRRLGRRRHAGRFARARRLVRADRQPRAPQRRRADWRRARAGGRAARSSSKTTCSSAGTAASTRARSSSGARCWRRAPSSPVRRRSTTCRTSGSSSPSPGEPLVVPEGAVVVPGRARSRRARDASGGFRSPRRSSSSTATSGPTRARRSKQWIR